MTTDLTEEDQQRRIARIFDLRREGATFQQIGDDLGLSRQRAHQIYRDALAAIPSESVALYRAEQAERLDDMLRRAYVVLNAGHPLVQSGRVVRRGEAVLDDEGRPVIDDAAGEELRDAGPVLAAIKVVLQVEERRARLFGLDAPVRAELSGGVQVSYQVQGIPDEELRASLT